MCDMYVCIQILCIYCILYTYNSLCIYCIYIYVCVQTHDICSFPQFCMVFQLGISIRSGDGGHQTASSCRIWTTWRREPACPAFSFICSWLGARRRPPHETVFLLFHLNGATARVPFFIFLRVLPQWNIFFCLFLLFFLSWCWLETSFFAVFCFFFCRGVGWRGWGGWGGGGGCGGVGGGVITFFRLEHIWDNTSWDLFLDFKTSGMVRHEIFSYTSTHLGWYVMRSFLTLQHIWDGTSWDLFLHFNTSGMVRHEIFSYTSTHLGWYVMRSFLTLQHIWDGTSGQLAKHAVDENKNHALKWMHVKVSQMK